jgi:hypothetical protein
MIAKVYQSPVRIEFTLLVLSKHCFPNIYIKLRIYIDWQNLNVPALMITWKIFCVYGENSAMLSGKMHHSPGIKIQRNTTLHVLIWNKYFK